MEKTKVLERSKELVNQIFSKMSIIESCDTVVDMIKDLEVCFYNPDSQKNVVLSEVMSEQQLSEVREGIISKIYSNSLEAQLYLERLDRKPAIVDQEFEVAVKDMEQSVKKQPDPVEEKPTGILQEEAKRIEELPVPLKPSEILEQHSEEIEKMYKIQMATVGSIAEKFGVKKTDVNTFLQKHKLFRTTRKDDGFLDAKVQARQKQPAETECL